MKKIQAYFLVNYPLLWNVRLVPALVAIIVLNSVAFLQGYWGTNIDWRIPYWELSNSGSIVFDCVVCTLVLIFWLIYYSRNNAFKYFYPKRALSLWLEWLLIFGILFGIASTPLTIDLGSRFRLSQEASIEKVTEVQSLLESIHIFIPQEDNTFFKEDSTNNSKMNETGSMSGTYSLLNYKYNYLNEDSIEKQWLINGNTQAIRAVMKKYLDLECSHGLHSSLDVDTWFKLIYNPPNFPVTSRNSIAISSRNAEDNGEYLNYDSMSYAYRGIGNAYDMKDFYSINLFILYFSMVSALLIFGYRITSKRSWITALISATITSIVFLLLKIQIPFFGSLGFQSGWCFYLVMNLLSALAIGINFYVIIRDRIVQKFSGVMVVLMLMMLPFIVILVYNLIDIFYLTNHLHTDGDYIDSFDKYLSGTLYFNIVFTCVAMFGVCCIIKKWKGLPEE